MMNLLIVSATKAEVQPLLDIMPGPQPITGKIAGFTLGNLVIDVLITGAGMVATAAHTVLALSRSGYQLALNAGICGSFEQQIDIGEVVQITSDYFPEMGAEDGEDFLSLHGLGLADANEFPFVNGKIVSPGNLGLNCLTGIRQVSGVTVNTVHGNSESITRFMKNHPSATESMEGAAFAYACKLMNIEFMQVRAVSNYVTLRNKSGWNVPLAVANLNQWLTQLLAELQTRI